MKFEIINRFTGAVQFTAEIECAVDALPSVKLGLAIKAAIKEKANLSGANLYGANLSGANLYGANLYGANLRSADLSGADLRSADLRSADLSGADLSGADLPGANLYGADLSGANLSGANLYGANLSGANLYGANLSGANLRSANLSGADLRSANLSGANLYGADLSGAKNADLAIARTRILPEGSIIGWKKCRGGVIVKLRIPEDARRSHAFGRKCRAEFAEVLEVFGDDVGVSNHDGKTEYRVGQRVTPDAFSEDWQTECASGIHFFITRIEAENY
jgi:uncharacterized protein YjbI with pentapeptide repeats